MLEKIKRVFGKSTTKADTVKTPAIPKSQYSFVEQYVIADPNRIMNGGYDIWGLCKFTPVAYEGEETTGFLSTLKLPTDWALPFLKTLKNSDPEIRQDPRQRLISVINLDEKHKLYVVPNLKAKKSSIIVGEHNDDEKRKNDWLFYITPEINRAIVEQAKIRSRG